MTFLLRFLVGVTFLVLVLGQVSPDGGDDPVVLDLNTRCDSESAVCTEIDACGNVAICQAGECVIDPGNTVCLNDTYQIDPFTIEYDFDTSIQFVPTNVGESYCVFLGQDAQTFIALETPLDVSAGAFNFGFDVIITIDFASFGDGSLPLPASASGCVTKNGFEICFQQEPAYDCQNAECNLGTSVCGAFDLTLENCTIDNNPSGDLVTITGIYITDTNTYGEGETPCLFNLLFELISSPTPTPTPVGQGCVNGPGYWRMNFESCQVLSDHPIIFGDLTTEQLFAQSPKGGNLWAILVRQYLAAVFNINCVDESGNTTRSNLLFEIAEFLDNTKYQIFPRDPNRAEAGDYIDILATYNDGESGLPSCNHNSSSAGTEKDQEYSKIFEALRDYRPGAFDWAFQSDSKTGLPTGPLNLAGGLMVAGLVAIGLAGLAVVGVLLVRHRLGTEA